MSLQPKGPGARPRFATLSLDYPMSLGTFDKYEDAQKAVDTLSDNGFPVENCLIARYTPAGWRATMYGMKFVLALGLSSVGVPLVALIYGRSGSFDGVFWALIVCAAIVMAVGIALPRSTNPAPVPAIEPAE